MSTKPSLARNWSKDTTISSRGAATDEITLRRTRAVLDSINLRPRMLTDISHRFPITDAAAPDSLELTTAVLDAIDEHVDEGRTVYVHCLGGMGRTGTIIGCWLARHGHPGQAALDRLPELWQECPKSKYTRSPETWEQAQYVLNWEER